MGEPAELPRPVNEYRLNEDNELRIEVAEEEIIMELLEGVAEVFGTALTLHKRYSLPPSNYNISRVMYLNAHFALETMREKAEVELTKPEINMSARGPCIMIAGPTDVGKSTLCRILCNYAVREGRTPIFVDLDVGQRTISIPGSIGAVYIERPADIVENFDSKAAFFGSVTPSANIILYDMLVKELAIAVKKRAQATLAANVGGIVINTCAEAFQPDVVIVLDHERLFNELQHDLPSFVKVLHFPKSGGAEPRSQATRRLIRESAIHKYFYGTKYNSFFPHTIEISYNRPAEEQELIIAKIGAEQLPDSCLPYGMVVEDHRTMVVNVQIGPELKNHVLALMPPECVSINQSLIRQPCLGFLIFKDINLERKTFTILSPQSTVPSRIAVLSDVIFTDDNV